jgi:hypothetical protein
MTGLTGNVSGVTKAMGKVAWAEQLEQEDSWGRSAKTGQTGQDRTSWVGHLGLDDWDRTAETGRTGQVDLIGNLD